MTRTKVIAYQSIVIIPKENECFLLAESKEITVEKLSQIFIYFLFILNISLKLLVSNVIEMMKIMKTGFQ